MYAQQLKDTGVSSLVSCRSVSVHWERTVITFLSEWALWPKSSGILSLERSPGLAWYVTTPNLTSSQHWIFWNPHQIIFFLCFTDCYGVSRYDLMWIYNEHIALCWQVCIWHMKLWICGLFGGFFVLFFSNWNSQSPYCMMKLETFSAEWRNLMAIPKPVKHLRHRSQ